MIAADVSAICCTPLPALAAAICPCHWRVPGQTTVAHLCHKGLPKYLPDKLRCRSASGARRTLSLLLILPRRSCTWYSRRLLWQGLQ